MRTSPNAPGVAAAEGLRQPKQPKQPKPKSNRSEAELHSLFLARLKHACGIEDTIQDLIAQRKELHGDIRAEGGQESLEAIKLGVKVRDPDKRARVIHSHAITTSVLRWTGGDSGGNRKTELENRIAESVQTSSIGHGGHGDGDAESGDANGEAGGGETREAVPVQSLDSWPVFD